ncbi:family 16 glycosylhydrolase [Flavobacterium sp. Sd200]|uniref:glycoside hydrolase family 16 protein n=1 Tax=Flavobacterium sp. Sd200 TaxID=2692211 RepID=UPI001370F374|nr:family 16 glycosylhydrolase [Flavobacterium sp. Sd200]MXN90908.1 family 16 glycosylhydrolase [Flavobacterium sp. Sd200]
MRFTQLVYILLAATATSTAQQKKLYYEHPGKWETVLDSASLQNKEVFDKNWNMFYPWGIDHNGSARMYADEVNVKKGVLTLTAQPVSKPEGKSPHLPYAEINYHSGAVHAKHQINITEEYPEYRVYGEFKAPVAKGTWPAFWLTAVKGWPPETDILEFKGDSLNWQNTFITPKDVTTVKQTVPDAMQQWHSYEAVLKRVDAEHTSITYYFDGVKQAEHQTNFTGKPMWLIVNLQMEGSSGAPGPKKPVQYLARNITVQRIKGH